MRGDIYSPFAGRAKEYAWSLCLKNAPRKITPTDIDYMTECNGHFLFFEMKTEGASMPYGQQLAFERLLLSLPNRAVLMLVTHTSVAVVKMPISLRALELWVSDGVNIRKRSNVQPERFVQLYAAFFSWAEGNRAAFRQALTSEPYMVKAA